ncbi:MAG: N-acetylmuramoyl-L-alanine amidase [Clostridia bacterium]|nr:N-acetylmuramoyl-L-alanine amidase [Clostridia bacterium]
MKKLAFNALIIFVLFALTLTLTLLLGYNYGEVSRFSPKKITVVIDAGHGGIDVGASGVLTSVRESDLNLIISKKLQEKFAVSGIKTVMTRTDDNGLYGTTDPGFKMRDLKKRVEIINGCNASVFISIHLNTYTSPKRRGAQTFYNGNSESAKKLATFIQNGLNVAYKMPRMCSALKGDYYLLNESKCPSVIVECGFLSSPEDERLLLTEEYREGVANAIFEGTLKYLTQN